MSLTIYMHVHVIYVTSNEKQFSHSHTRFDGKYNNPITDTKA